jgi:shikimate dehydrogenase
VLNAAVLGKPVAHSLSPVLHTAGYRALGLADWAYAAHEVDVDGLVPFVAGLDETWRGLSLTMPLKQVALTVAATVSENAGDTGAANTLVRRDSGEWDAYNTDVVGLVRALGAVDHGGSAVILGSGSTARSAAAALAELGVQDVTVAARNAHAAGEVLRVLEERGVAGQRLPLEEWAGEPRRLVLSTLPPQGGLPAAAELSAAATPGAGWAGATLLDVVYADWPTPLALAAAAAGMEVLSGLDMLVHQAAEQFRLFTGRDAPLGAMFAAGREALVR